METRKTFHHELAEIHEEMVQLIAGVAERIPRGTEALLNDDLETADFLIKSDEEYNERAVELELRCYDVVARQQPMAGDLRALMATVRSIGEAERSADLVVNICKAARRMHGMPLPPRVRGLLSSMSDQAQQEFRFAVEAFAERDAPLANVLSDMDDRLDAMHAELIQGIFECHREGTLDISASVQLALVARFYERIGDHAVNIGERIRYMATGELEDKESERNRDEPPEEPSE